MQGDFSVPGTYTAGFILLFPNVPLGRAMTFFNLSNRICSSLIRRDVTGFVSYDNRDSAEKAISQMNGYQVRDARRPGTHLIGDITCFFCKS